MKQTIVILAFSLLMACNNDSKKEVTQEPTPKTKLTKQEEAQPMASGDYSTLLTNYSCDMDIAEIARVLGVPETDLTVTENMKPPKCHFSIKGFGEDAIGGQTRLRWGISPSSKGQNRKEIKNYIKNQKELPAKVIQYMSIALADTKDCYIAQQPAHGRVIIYNENYETAFILNYGRKATLKRTKEQHDELKAKMTNLANYLLKKHRK